MESNAILKPRSTFHNYVCEALLQTIEKPVRVVDFEEKLSNPASTRAKLAERKKESRTTTPVNIVNEQV